MATVLVVDDDPINLELLCGLLSPEHSVLAVTSGERALRLLDEQQIPDLILLDLMLTGMNGFEVLRRLKADPATAAIPVIIVTAMQDGDIEERGLALGAADFLSKPVRHNAALARVRMQLELREARRLMLTRNALLEAEVRRRISENSFVQDASILVLAHLAETRDPETGNHLRRTQGYVRTLCESLQDHPRFCSFLTSENIALLVKSAPLHDIGKVGIPDRILLKPGPLTPEEWTTMKTHSQLGSAAIERVEAETATALPFMEMAKQIARHHHERWDGTGYPDGLRGNEIPIPARLMAIADVFDALISRRPYKEPLPLAHSVAIIMQGRGTHFDPDVADAFSSRVAVFQQIASRHADTAAEIQARLDRLRGNLEPAH